MPAKRALKKIAFISSTFADLAEHRRAVWSVLESFKVSVRGMERFGARPEAPVTTCLAEVDQSDVFVLILAFRLGSSDQRTGKSFTQLEYDRAIARNMPVLVYIADDKQALVHYGDIDLESSRIEALSAFKRSLREQHTVNHFTSPDDLASKVKQDLRVYFSERPEKRTTTQQEWEETRVVLDRFSLLPAEASGTDVRLRLEAKGAPFAAARALCEPFNLSYGRTIGIPMRIVEPQHSFGKGFSQIFASGARATELMALSSPKKPLDLYATLRFTPKDVSRTHAELIGYHYNQYAISEPEDEVYVAPEGQAILLYSKPAGSN